MYSECTRCGLCCFSLGNKEYHVEVDEEDLDKMTAHYRKLCRQTFKEHGVLALPTKRHEKGIVCAAFNGKLFGKCKCRIYKQRPKACRALEEESTECYMIRQAYFDKHEYSNEKERTSGWRWDQSSFTNEV